MDQGHIETEKLLVALERRIEKVYGEASKDLQKKADAYFAKFIERDKKQQELLKAGKITEEQYKQWRLAQMGRGERFIALRDDLAKRMNEANKVAVSYINDETPSIYSLNHNYAAYEIEQVAGNVGFTLYDEQTVRRLIAEDPTLLPKRRVDAPKDLKWNKKRFTAEITAGILSGESIGKLANRVQNLSDANRSGAIRNARTAVTGAQNAGRQESYNRAKKMGLKLSKRWIATKDNRTRHEHAMLDGQTVPLDKPFQIDGHKLMFPGDPTGLARLVWNCRCTMRTVEKEGIEAEPRQMRVRNPETGLNELISEITYAEWVGWKKTQEPPVEIIKKTQAQEAAEKAENQERIRKRREEYFARKRQSSEPDFESMTKAQLNKYVSENIYAKFIDVSGVNTDFYRKTVKAVKRVETKYGKIDGLSIEFGGIKGNAYAEYDQKTKTLHLKKKGSLSQFADSIAKADEKAMRKYGKKYNAESSYEGTVFHELAHAIDHDGGWSLSKSLGATDDILIKSRSISFYARDRGVPNLPRATEATAENLSSYFMGNTEKIDKDVLAIIEEYLKRKKK